jgi:capsular exopolysaccharide synthesis family protein
VSNIKEAIRQINGSLPSESNGSKVILFKTLTKTNSEQTVIANLALMYARAGEKVLILDTDFSSKVFNQAFGLKSQLGLSDYLSGGSSNVANIIQAVSGENISIVCSGTLPLEDTAYLLGDPKMMNFMEKINNKYDRILISTAVFESKSNDEYLLKYADGVVIVQDLKAIKKMQMLSMLDMLDKSNVKVLGYISAKK